MNSSPTDALFGVELPLNVADPFLTGPERFWQARLMPENRWPDIPQSPHGAGGWATRLHDLGVDFTAYNLRPHQPEAALRVADWARNNHLGLLLNNPYCQINGTPVPGLLTWAYDPDLTQAVAQKCDLVGILYDELIHHQVHNGLDGHTNPWNALADVTDVADSETAAHRIEAGLKQLFDYTRQTGIPAITEQVVPAFYHAVARAGGVPGTKVLKEHHTPITTSLCMSAAYQYQTHWHGTVDLWEGDSGPWYQVMARQSGHGVPEFRNALKLMALLNPRLVLIEAADLLWDVDTAEGEMTEFGEAVRQFMHHDRPKLKPAFDALTWQPTVAIVHAEDGAWHKGIAGDVRWGRRCGSPHLTVEEVHRKWLRVWYHLTWGKVNGSFHIHLTEQAREMAVAEANFIGGTEHDMALWPLDKRRDPARQESHLHNLFMPLNNVAVFDAFVQPNHLQTADLVVLCGSYCPPGTLAVVRQAVQNGATCLCQTELAPPDLKAANGQRVGQGLWFTVEDFDTTEAVDQFYQHKGFQNQWTLKSNLGTLQLWATDRWGNEIDWALR